MRERKGQAKKCVRENRAQNEKGVKTRVVADIRKKDLIKYLALFVNTCVANTHFFLFLSNPPF